MKTKITERENFFRMMRRESPHFVAHQPSLLQMILPSALGDRPHGQTIGEDWFGVLWTEDPGMPGLKIVSPEYKPVLEDITQWRDKIIWPDLDDIDWAARAKEDVPEKDPTKILCAMMVSGPFERLHDLLGFENALCSLMTDPEECGAFFSALCDFKIEQIKYLKKYYDVDMVHFQDDWGNQKNLFFKPDLWRELIKPHIQRVVDATHELDIAFDMHSCGKIDLVVDDIINMGVDVLDPMQPVNDLPAWAEKYNGKVIFMGALNAQSVIDLPNVTHEEIVREVQEKIDLFGKNGYFIPFCVGLSNRVPEAMDECFIYGRTLYNNTYEDDVENFTANLNSK